MAVQKKPERKRVKEVKSEEKTVKGLGQVNLPRSPPKPLHSHLPPDIYYVQFILRIHA